MLDLAQIPCWPLTETHLQMSKSAAMLQFEQQVEMMDTVFMK